jgi:hypothetical protein
MAQAFAKQEENFDPESKKPNLLPRNSPMAQAVAKQEAGFFLQLSLIKQKKRFSTRKGENPIFYRGFHQWHKQLQNRKRDSSCNYP